jgi:hypothetical protein
MGHRTARSVRFRPSLVLLASIALGGMFVASAPPADAQVTAWNDQNQHRKGQSVSPVYEGWYRGADGLIRVLFGYQNRNIDEKLDIPVGPNNKVEPGPADQGQPTHFLSGKQYGVFAITLPKDSAKEVTWTITSNGNTFAIPANLDATYIVEALKTMYTNNEPPQLKFEATGPSVVGPAGVTVSRTATLSAPLTIDVWVSDATPVAPRRRPAPNARQEPSSTEGAGLTVKWSKFRGPGDVSFDNANPPINGGKATTVVSFREPGEYALRAVASDGSSFGDECCWTNGYVKVTVGAGK